MFSKYYQSELTFLREMGAAFGRANPALAGLLAERGGDPDVERLLEGFAFLTARVRERIDDAVPEVVQGLAELLLPHYLRVLPASTVVEFAPLARALRARSTLPRGTEVSSTPVDGTSCLFRTTAEVDLLPLTLVETVLENAGSSTPSLKLQFHTTVQGKAEVFQERGVTLYLHGDYPQASTVLLWLARHCTGITVRSSEGIAPVRLPPSHLRFVGADPERALLPWPTRALEGFRSIQELFLSVEKFLFVSVEKLQQAAGAAGERFEMAFELDRPPPISGRLPKDIFRLHCAPVVNLFSSSADPVATRLVGQEHLVRASGLDPQHMEVYSVDGVTGLRAGRGERRRYAPYTAFAHARGEEATAFYRIRRARSVLDDGMDVFLSFEAPREVPAGLEEETLSIELTCTNRSLPTRLQVGDVSVPTPSSPSAVRFKNITAVRQPVRPPLGTELHWRLLSHLALNQRSLMDAEALRAVMALYNFDTSADLPTSRANALRIGSVRSVRAEPATTYAGGAPVRGTRVRVEVDEAGFAGPGDIFLFGSALDELLAHHVSLNAFSELRV
ncbi:MAG TPA: type VI secretion system baseplate subunit TssF, partial [Myxococcaceae bacterium]|nr:type VI secretion system baseplate subunit TssF [Myxococcaceae bacterium]